MPITLNSPDTAEDYILEVSGDLDESITLPTKKFRLSQRIIFNCEKAAHISSYAAQTWSRWMHTQDQRQQFVFRAVSPRIVDLFNLIEGFLPQEAVIESFYVPYECEACSHEELLLARRGREFIEALGDQPAKLLLPQEINCPKCKSGMKLGVWESKYLRFLNSPNHHKGSQLLSKANNEA